MQVVVNIPDDMWERVKDGYVPLGISTHLQNGTPLPKGHGRLIDAELLDMKRIDYIVDGYANDADDCAEFGMMIILAPTIIEADGGDTNADSD